MTNMKQRDKIHNRAKSARNHPYLRLAYSVMVNHLKVAVQRNVFVELFCCIANLLFLYAIKVSLNVWRLVKAI